MRKKLRVSSKVINYDLFRNQESSSPKVLTGSNGIATRDTAYDFYGLLGDLPNPDPILKKLGRDIQVYDDVRYDSRVNAVVQSRKSAVTSQDWEVVGEGVPEAELVWFNNLFATYNMHDIISEVLDAALYGYKPIEILWTREGNYLVPEMVGKPPRWFRYDLDNNPRYLTKANMSQGILLPPNKFIMARNEPSYDNPYGFPVLSSVFWPVSFRRNGFKWWTIFLEKYGMPYLKAKAPMGAKESEISSVADMLEAMIQDAIAVVPADYDVEVIEASKVSSSQAYKQFIDQQNVEIAVSIIGGNLSTEVQGGSYAAATAQMLVRADIIESDKVIVQGAFDELIRIVHAFNFRGDKLPYFRLYTEAAVDKTRSERDLTLSRLGVKFTPAYIAKAYDLQETDFVLREVQEVSNE